MPARSSVGLNFCVFSSAIAASTAALRAGVSSRSPGGAAKTRLSTPPCSEANSLSIRSVARCVSEPGISNSSLRPPPNVATRPIRTTRMPSQLKTTRHGWVAQARIQRASPPVERRSCASLLSAAVFRPSCSLIVIPLLDVSSQLDRTASQKSSPLRGG
jgi:hypothetical protein